MASSLDAITGQAAADGQRRHSRWDAALFQTLARGQARMLWYALEGEPWQEAIVRAYLNLAAEAIGQGYLDRAALEHLQGRAQAPDSVNLLGLMLVQLVHTQLPELPASQRLPVLARAWNLCEGLLQQPAWLNRYVASAASPPPALAELETFLVRTLEPALASDRRADFRGPFTLAVLDARQVDDELLPGDMHLAAPAVLCIHDRLRPGIQAGAFLAPGGKSRFLGLTPCLASGYASAGAPGVEVHGSAVRVNGVDTALPLLGRVHRLVTGPAGFVVASAVDSQRLWVLDTP